MEECFSLLGKKPKKHHLIRLLHPISLMWYTIGELLHVNDSDLMYIAEYNVAYDNTIQLAKVFQIWLDKRTCEVSWRTIITVVKEPLIENKHIADEIYQFLSRPDIQNEYLSSQQPGKF